MARYLAVARVPGLTEPDFRNLIGGSVNWRIDRRSWVVKAYCSLEQGTLFLECETPERRLFEQWLRQKGWTADAIYPIDLIHEGNAFWQV